MTQTQNLDELSSELAAFSDDYKEQFSSDNQTRLFRILGIETHEKRLTRVLRWVLDPNETHGAGSCFLDGFLDALEEGPDVDPNPKTVTVDALKQDIGSENAEIDLLIRYPGVCIGVEIKTTHEGDEDKLQKEFDAQRDVFAPGSDHYFVYLRRSTTDATTIPDDNFSTLYWGDVGETLEQQCSAVQANLDQTIIQQFVTTIREHIMSDFKELCSKTELYLDYDPAIEDVRNKYQKDRKSLLKTIRDNFISTRSDRWESKPKSIDKRSRRVSLRRKDWENASVRFRYQFSARIRTREQKGNLHSKFGTDGDRPHIDVNLDIKSRSSGSEEDRGEAVDLFDDALDENTRTMLETNDFVIGWGHSSHYVSKPIFLDTEEPMEAVETAIEMLSEIEETVERVTDSDDWSEF